MRSSTLKIKIIIKKGEAQQEYETYLIVGFTFGLFLLALLSVNKENELLLDEPSFLQVF